MAAEAVLYVFRDDFLQLILSKDNGGGLPLLHCVLEEEINKASTLTIEIPSNHEDSYKIQSGDKVILKDYDATYRAFIVSDDEERHDDEFRRVLYCEDLAVVELNDDIVEDVRPFNTTAENALERILESTNWSVGSVDAFGNNSTNVYYVSAMEGLRNVIETWGGELRFRVTLDTLRNKITGRYVDLFAQIGSFTGRRFEFGKDLKSIDRSIDPKELKTALYGRGKGEETDSGGYGRRITFASVVWSKSNGDPADKPAGQEWIGDSEALAAWGHNNPDGTKRHKMGVYTNEEQTDAEKLLDETWSRLQEIKAPKASYSINVVDLERALVGYQHEAVRLGDTVFVIDKHFATQQEIVVRVVSIKRDLLYPENTKIELGTAPGDITSLIRRLESQVNKKVGLGDPIGWLEGIIDAETTQFEARSAFVYINNTDGVLITNRPRDNIDNPPDQAIQLKAGALAIANSRTQQGDWNWRTFITGERIIADEINSGRIRTDNVEVGDDEGKVLISGGDVTIKGGALKVYTTMDADEEAVMISGNKIETNFIKNADFVRQPSGNPVIDWELPVGTSWNSSGYVNINGVNTANYWNGINQWMDVYHPQATFQALFDTPVGGSVTKKVRIYIYCYDANGNRLPDQFRDEVTPQKSGRYLLQYRMTFSPGTTRARVFFQTNYEVNATNAFKLHWVKGYYDDYMMATSMLMTPVDVYNIQAVPECQLISINVPFAANLTADTLYQAGDVFFDRPFEVSGTQGVDYEVFCNLSPVDYPDYNAVAAFVGYASFQLRIMPMKNINRTTSRQSLQIRGFAYKVNYPAKVTTASI